MTSTSVNIEVDGVLAEHELQQTSGNSDST